MNESEVPEWVYEVTVVGTEPIEPDDRGQLFIKRGNKFQVVRVVADTQPPADSPEAPHPRRAPMDDVARARARDLKSLRRISRHLDKLSPIGIAWLRSFLADSYDADGRARYGVKP